MLLIPEMLIVLAQAFLLSVERAGRPCQVDGVEWDHPCNHWSHGALKDQTSAIAQYI